MKKLVFYRCAVCGNVAIKLVDKGVPMFCCGQKMVELEPNTNEGAVEKHIPVGVIEGGEVKIQVGSTLHPMTEEHYISLIVIETNKGFKVFNLTSNDQPIVSMPLSKGEKYVKSFAFCNLHGLWEASAESYNNMII